MWEALNQLISSLLAALLVVVIPLFQAVALFPDPCDKPLNYSLEQIDPRFQVTDEEVKTAMAEAEALWEEALNKELFVYDANADFTVHFTYDDRQKRTQEEELLQQKRTLLEAEGEALSDAQYVKAKEDYETTLAEYERRVSEYNDRVEEVNRSGGASEEEYEELQEKQKSLRRLYDEVEEKRRVVNAQAKHFNSSLVERNQAIGEFNQSIDTFEERYGSVKQFDQGIYDGRGITVYQFADRERSKYVLPERRHE